ncbi:MAG: hypothetical protein ABUL73_01920 [Alphaproteobacteria bacterium]
MRLGSWLGGLLCAAALTACQQPQATTAPTGPADVVLAIYTAAAPHLAQKATGPDEIPMTPDLAQSVARAQAEADRRQEPFIDGDLAFDCQDCSDFSALAITTTTAPANGRAVIEAHFSITGETRVVIWDMLETPQGWRVDNIRTPDGSDLRGLIREELSQPAQSCEQEKGAQAAAALVRACMQVSPATHPPCNAQNTCAMIQDEITRSCALISGAKPASCTAPTAPANGKAG